MEIDRYARGIPTYKGENDETVGLLCETKEQCITDDEGVNLSDKLKELREKIGEQDNAAKYATEEFVEEYVSGKVKGLATETYVTEKVSGFATEDYVNEAVSELPSKEYVDEAVSDLASKEDVTEAVSDLASAESVTNIVNGTTKVGKAGESDKATQDGKGNVIADTYLLKNSVVVTADEPGVGVEVPYEDGTFIFVKE